METFPAVAADLVRRGVAVILASGPPAARAAKAVTTIVPIVFGMGEDPVEEGIVENSVPTITFVSPAGDPRLVLVADAVAFWNETFGQLGTPFRLGA